VRSKYLVFVESLFDVVDLSQVVVAGELEVVAVEDGGERPVDHFEFLLLVTVDRHGSVGVLQTARVDRCRLGFRLAHPDQVAEA